MMKKNIGRIPRGKEESDLLLKELKKDAEQVKASAMGGGIDAVIYHHLATGTTILVNYYKKPYDSEIFAIGSEENLSHLERVVDEIRHSPKYRKYLRKVLAGI